MSFTLDGKRFVTVRPTNAGDGSTIIIWDTATSKELNRLSVPFWGWSMDVTADGVLVATTTGKDRKTVKIWDTWGKELATLTHESEVKFMAFTSGAKVLFTSTVAPGGGWGTEFPLGYKSQHMNAWNVATGKQVVACTVVNAVHTEFTGVGCSSVDGRMVADFVSSYDGWLDLKLSKDIVIWDASGSDPQAKRKRLRALRGHAEVVLCAAFAPDGKSLASGSADKTIKLWDLASGEENGTLQGHTNSVRFVAFNEDGTTLISVDTDHTIKLWDAASRKGIATLSGHRDTITCLALGPDGKTLASACKDGTVKLWEVAPGKNTATLRGHASAVKSLAFSPDGKTLASGGANKTVRIWRIAGNE
jgi:WD40 repeat protein